MRGHIGDVIDRILVARVGDEADPFRIGNGAGKGLRERRIAGEFEDAGIIELIGAEMFAVIIERQPHRLQHPVDIVSVLGIVIDGARHPAAQIGRFFGIVGGLDREERQDRRGPRHEARRAPAVRRCIGHAAPRRDRRLAGIGGDGDVGLHPAGIADIVTRRRRQIFQLGRAQLRRQLVAPPHDRVAKQIVTAHPDQRGEVEIVQETAIADDAGGVALRAETALPQLRPEGQFCRRAWRQWLVEAIDGIPGAAIVHHPLRAGHLCRENLQIGIEEAHMQVAERGAGVVDQLITARRIGTLVLGV